MKGLVVYSSKYGATAQYANWLGEELGFSVSEARRVGGLKEFEAILIGTDVIRDRLSIAPWVKRNWPRLEGKRLVFFSKMNWLDRNMMRFIIKRTAKSQPEVSARIGEEFDRIDRADIGPIVAYIRAGETLRQGA